MIVSCEEVFRVRGRRNPLIAGEGVLPMLIVAAAGVLLMRYIDLWYGLVPGIILLLMFLVFRDPIRVTPAVALGVASPVDGEVVAVETTDKCVVQGEAHTIRIRIDSLGAYTARSPVEGKVMDLHSSVQGVGPDCPANALWVRTDEGDDVVLQFHEYRFGIAPKSFVRFGERIGQGHRCAYLRLAQFAEVYMPIDGKVLVRPGQKVLAGSDIIGTVPHP
jgi:phosphatidylserine decarboxylase